MFSTNSNPESTSAVNPAAVAAAGTSGGASGTPTPAASAVQTTGQNAPSAVNPQICQWIIDLTNSKNRETALLELR